ncbi:WxL domain-containing protein [Listeria kieliensis]
MIKKTNLSILMFLSCCILLLNPLSADAAKTASYTSDVGLSFSEKMPPKPEKPANNKTKVNPSHTNTAKNPSPSLNSNGKKAYHAQKLPNALPQTGDKSSLAWMLVGLFILSTLTIILFKKQTKKILLLFSGLVLFLGGWSAFEKNATAATTTSKAALFYLPPDEVVTTPKHPYHPNQDVDFADSNRPTESKGPLSLDFVPTIQFSARRGSWEEETYFARLIQVRQPDGKGFEEIPNYVQVTDDRGTLSGWTLVLRQNGPFRNGASTLKGAAIKLTKLQMVAAEPGRVPTAFQEIVLDPEGKESSLLIQAKKGTGAGTWLGLFGKNNAQAETAISVTVPGDITKEPGQYTTSLTWELQDSPI